MTPARQKVLKFIEGFIGEHGYAPSYPEIMEGCDIASKSNLHRMIGLLEKDGFIQVKRHRRRGILLSRAQCPYCGTHRKRFSGNEAIV